MLRPTRALRLMAVTAARGGEHGRLPIIAPFRCPNPSRPMEAERLNQIAANATGLRERLGELRRYL